LGHSKGTSCRTPLAKILHPPLQLAYNKNALITSFLIEHVEEEQRDIKQQLEIPVPHK